MSTVTALAPGLPLGEQLPGEYGPGQGPALAGIAAVAAHLPAGVPLGELLADADRRATVPACAIVAALTTSWAPGEVSR